MLKRGDLPSDVTKLQDLALAQDLRIEHLSDQVALLTRRLYGPSSEQRHALAGQPLLPGLELPAAPTPPQALEQAQVVPTGEKRAQPHGRRQFPREMARHRIEYQPPEAGQPCPCCGGALERIGEEVSEQIEFVPATFLVLEHARLKYACPKCKDRVVIGAPPAKIIDKGVAGAGLLADLITNKLYYHLPLYRQELLTEQLGWTLARSTQGQWLGACAERLEPLYLVAVAEVRASQVLHTDDTPVRVLAPGTGKTREAHLWTYVGDEGHPQTVFAYTPNRQRTGPQTWLKDFRGVLQADAYGGYDGLYAGDLVKEAACWAHARRKFDEAQVSAKADAEWMLARIGALYQVEAAVAPAVAEACLKPEAERAAALATAFEKRRAARQQYAVPVLAQIREWLERQRREVLPQSLLGKALQYTLNQWTALNYYLQDGAVDIDNNTAENTLRGIALGRRNWLFMGNDEGGRRAAILYSLVETCKRHSVPPWLYLRDVLVRIETQPPGTLRELLPDRWKLQYLEAAEADVAALRRNAHLAQVRAESDASPAFPVPTADLPTGPAAELPRTASP